MKYTVTAEQDGMTVKDFLFGTLGFSRAAVTRLKKRENGITVGGAHATVRAVLRAGDELVLRYEDGGEDVSGNILPVPMKLDILYEDDNIIACGKPPFQPTHPSHGHYDDTLANGLASYFALRGIPFVFRAVSRLDADTSGVVLAAKNKPAAAALSRQMLAKTVKKEYIAVLRGTLDSDEGEICGNIGRIAQSIIFREVKHDGSGAYALTRYRVLLRYELSGQPYTVVLAEPVTGRTHQLRVHFDSIGHTILGDRLYPVTVEAVQNVLRSRGLSSSETDGDGIITHFDGCAASDSGAVHTGDCAESGIAVHPDCCAESGNAVRPDGCTESDGTAHTDRDAVSGDNDGCEAGGGCLIRRQALHAAAISFDLPSGERIRVRSPLPDDILAVLPERLPHELAEYVF